MTAGGIDGIVNELGNIDRRLALPGQDDGVTEKGGAVERGQCARVDDAVELAGRLVPIESCVVHQAAQRQLLLTYNDFAVDCLTRGFVDEALLLLNRAIRLEKNEYSLYLNRGGMSFREKILYSGNELLSLSI